MKLSRAHLISIAVMFFAASASAQPQDSYESYWENRLDPRTICGKYDIKSDEAVRCYEKVMHDNPDSPDAHYFLGVAYVWSGDKYSTLKEYKVLREMEIGYAAMLIDVIYHVKPEWYNNYYRKEYKRLEEEWGKLQKKMDKRQQEK